MSGCLFCNMVEGKIPVKEVFSNEYILAFRDIDPKAPSHILVIPKKHVETIMDVDKDDLWWKEIPSAIQNIAKKEKIDISGFRLVSNCRKDAGQEVPHLHFHLLGGRKMTWPPG